MKPIIGLNGPPQCGKTYILDRLLEYFPHATVIKIQHGMFTMMKEARLCNTDLFDSYEDYKESSMYDRRGIIRFAAERRATYGEDVFVKVCESLPAFKEASLVLFDNIGFPADHAWAANIGAPYLLLRIDAPFKMSEPFKASQRRLDSNWLDDSRRPFMWPRMLTAYDSVQMDLLLEYIESASQSNSIAGPYNEYATIWKQFHGLEKTA